MKNLMKKVGIIIAIYIAVFAVISCKQDDEDNDSPEIVFTGDKNYVSPNNVEISDAENQLSDLDENWWNKTSFYHIWVKAFADSDNDGIGDLKGIEQKLDYIKNNVGCEGIWLSPIFECSYKGNNMHGYDVTDYYKINSKFGTEDDLISLIQACHEKNIKIIFDYVPNHTSNNNQWFLDSIEGKNGKSKWYIWKSSPNKFKNLYGSSAWYKASNNKYYYGVFTESQPDLNFTNYEVREEMKNVVRYWLNKGFDGLRIDAARYLVETSSKTEDTAETHKWFQELRKDVIDQYDSPKFMVSEAWITNNRKELNKYFGTDSNPEFNMVLDFDQGDKCLNAVYSTWDWDNELKNSLYSNPSSTKSYGIFLGNHDEYAERPEDWFSYDKNSNIKYKKTMAKQAAALSLLRPDVPFIYYGNERNQKSTNDNGDLRLRGNFNWNTIQEDIDDSESLLNFYKTLNNLRKTYPDLFANGTITTLDTAYIISQDTNEPWLGQIAYLISDGKNKLLCAFNLYPTTEQLLFFYNPAIYGELPETTNLIEDASVLIGNPEYNSLGYNSAQYTIGIHTMGPFSYRVYYIGDNTKENFWNDENPYEKIVYLRGTMNNWDRTIMTIDKTSSDEVYTVEVYFKKGVKQSFKIDEFNDWSVSYGGVSEENKVSLNTEIALSTEGGYNDLSFTPSSTGTHIITFNKSKKTLKIELK